LIFIPSIKILFFPKAEKYPPAQKSKVAIPLFTSVVQSPQKFTTGVIAYVPASNT